MPVMSEGIRSGVNWMRRKVQPSDRAIAFASVVLPMPGHVLEQDVALAEQRHHRQPHHVGLADDDALDARHEAVGGAANGIDIRR